MAEEVQKDEEMAARLAVDRLMSWPTPPSPPRQRVDESMAGAMMDLGVAPGANVPRQGQTLSQATDFTTAAGFLTSAATTAVHVDEITHLGHLADWRTDGFKPNIAIDLG